MKTERNVNVTLENQDLTGKLFPCPVCGASLSLRLAQTGKPYCHCDSCGIQLFFRGANGIQKLRKIVQAEVLTSGASRATLFYNRLQQLKEQKQSLEDQQGFIFRNQDLDQTIAKLQTEIEGVRKELEES